MSPTSYRVALLRDISTSLKYFVIIHLYDAVVNSFGNIFIFYFFYKTLQ